MPSNALLPVPVAGVENRPVPELYPIRTFQEGFDNEELQQVTDENVINKFQPDLLSFRSQGRLWQRAVHFNDYSFMFDHSWGESEHGRSSIKTNLKLSGTYDMNGEITITSGDRGIYIDRFS